MGHIKLSSCIYSESSDMISKIIIKTFSLNLLYDSDVRYFEVLAPQSKH